ncbi:hypothetical protein BJ138DRAFT_1150903 [Hygrophoropsis aurantiaca]|uniref:Uncharacterized protein n=1 Tax=Hygrophoropsis aurantiaca TaxID=72124 RepID=A0ACB8AD01_9AGAM|nr:hypothetical protein BJ138DRAFT_1150903 [Hygrophoropsis aurantiaca]
MFFKHLTVFALVIAITSAFVKASCHLDKPVRTNTFDFKIYNEPNCNYNKTNFWRAYSGHFTSFHYGCTTILGDVTKKDIRSYVFTADKNHQLYVYSEPKCRGIPDAIEKNSPIATSLSSKSSQRRMKSFDVYTVSD